MGLDGVELILAVEDAFQIHIADEEAGNVSTVGDLHNLVVSKLQGQDSKRCLTSAAFYRTRRGIVDTLGVDRRKIRPATPLEDLLPRNSRRVKWRRIQAAMKLKLPDLQHPGWIQLSLLTMGVALAVGPGVYRRVGYGWIALLFFLGLVVGGFLIRLSPVLAVAFPNRDATVGDLARDVLAVNHARLVDEVGSWNKKDVWEALCRVIVIQTAVAREKITPEAGIIDDLGID
jgi:hypothetical protein